MTIQSASATTPSDKAMVRDTLEHCRMVSTIGPRTALVLAKAYTWRADVREAMDAGNLTRACALADVHYLCYTWE